MKKLTLALSTLGISTSLLAALPAATDPTVVMVPQLPGGFVIGGSVFYMEALPTHGDVDAFSLNSGTDSTFFSELKNVEPGYDWGWGLNVGYIFPNTGNDINLSYFQYDTDDSDHFFPIVTTNGISLITPLNFLDELSFLTALARSKVEYDINQVDLTAGQYIDVGCRLIAHPYAGLRWAQVDRDLDNFLFGPSTDGTASSLVFIKEESDFDGIGPIVGLDASYYVYMGFGLVGHFDSALLVGNVEAKQTAVVAPGGEDPINPLFLFNYKSDDNNRIVPVIDGKLGLDYTYVFNNCENSDLTLEVGWQFSNYFNATDRMITSAALSGGSVTIFQRKTADLGIQGPYVSLVFHA